MLFLSQGKRHNIIIFLFFWSHFQSVPGIINPNIFFFTCTIIINCFHSSVAHPWVLSAAIGLNLSILPHPAFPHRCVTETSSHPC